MELKELYDQDFYAWTTETAKALKEQDFSRIDLEHLIEEIESVGASERRELKSRLKQLLMHLLKLKYQPNYVNTTSWIRSIKMQRKELFSLFKSMPSLKSTVESEVIDVYPIAVLMASEETGLDESSFPKTCPYSVNQLLDDGFFPGE